MMAAFSSLRAGLGLLALATFASAHSWVHEAFKVHGNGTMVGGPGYARGWVDRNTPGWNEEEHVNRLPTNPKPTYDDTMMLNQFKFNDNPTMPMLEASPGDFIALLHLENGHVTLPENQPMKPRNRGTIFIYGTAEPKESEPLFDVHLLWNKDGTGGDGRGRLLATRNYDDGLCFQLGAQPMSQQRMSSLSAYGATMQTELACQSDLQLPDDLEAGSIYTIYWYWDWPDLNPDVVDMEATADGVFPWSGSFVRGDSDPSGMPVESITKSESYASTVDIKITKGPPGAQSAKVDANSAFITDQDIYSRVIKEQLLDNNFAVKVPDNRAGDDTNNGTVPSPPPAESTGSPSPTQVPDNPGSDDGPAVTVTITETVPPSTSTVMVTVTVTSTPSTSAYTPSSTVTIIETSTATRPPQTPLTPTSTAKVIETSYFTRTPEPTPTAVETPPFGNSTAPTGLLAKRTHWGFGRV